MFTGYTSVEIVSSIDSPTLDICIRKDCTYKLDRKVEKTKCENGIHKTDHFL